jgi:hypothetical protein
MFHLVAPDATGSKTGQVGLPAPGQPPSGPKCSICFEITGLDTVESPVHQRPARPSDAVRV